MIGGAERRHYDPHLPSTPGWQLCVMQQSLGRTASMPASAQVQTVTIAVQLPRNRTFVVRLILWEAQAPSSRHAHDTTPAIGRWRG
jgi:hypothetical protein